MNIKYLISLLASVILAQHSAAACPNISGYPDLNCDGNISIAVLGDSLVYGVGDTKNQNKGGYVLRAQAKLPALNFINLGEPGLNTVELLLSLKQAFKGKGEKQLLAGLTEADVVVLDLGRNDRWFFGTPENTYRNLKKIRSTIKTEVLNFVGITPLVVTSVLMLPNRGSQGPWVLALNKLIAAHHSGANPADLHFDSVSKRLLSSDQIHPTSLGYNSMSSVFIGYVRSKMKQYMNKLVDSLPTPTVTPTAVPTVTPTVAPTEVPVATPTATPTVTATPS